jgi:vacuolar-type H+-ATPase subunit I/STV1
MIKELHLANAELGKQLALQPKPIAMQSSIDELWKALQEVESVLHLRATRSLTHLANVRRGLVELYKVAEKQKSQSFRRGVVSLLNQIEDEVEAVTEILSTDCESNLKASIEGKSEVTTESARESIASPVHRVLVAQEERIKRLEEEREMQSEALKKLEQTLQDQIYKGFRHPSPTQTIPSYFPSPDQPLNERIAKVYFSSSGGSHLQEQISALDEEILELQHDLQQALTTR